MGLHFIKNGTKHDVCVKRPSLFPASATTYDNSNSGLSATRVQGAIDEVAGKVDRGSVSVTADGVKTYGTLLSELFTLTDAAKFTPFTKIIFYDTNSGYQTVYTARLLTSSSGYFYYVGILGTGVATIEVLLSSSPHYLVNNNGSYTDRTGTVPTSGVILKLVY